jgi:sigma-70-like protein/anti-sigma-K factor RskA
MGGRMSPLEPLAPDQRAVVALVLQQGRSYDEIAALLGIPVDAVRARAQAGLAALAPGNGLPGEITAPLADYLLGQQPDADAESTRGLLAESAPARAWASDVAARLADVAKTPLPELPADEPPRRKRASKRAPAATADASAAAPPPAADSSAAAAPPPGPRPRPVREAAGDEGGGPPASSKLGGVLLIAAVIAVVGVVLFLVLRGGDDEEPAASSGTPTATATATPTAQPQVADQITLRATGGGKAKGTMTVYLQGEQLLFALQGENLPPSSDNAAYAVWLTGPGAKARRLGFTDPVGEDGKLGIQGPSEKDLADFPKMYATYANVVVSQESTEDAKRPSRIVLTGKLPQGR